MPRDKDFKRLVRTRMTKTGEAYTAARAQLLEKAGSPALAATPTEYAALAGTSDDTLHQRTGRTWEAWVHALDGHGAVRMPHRDIALLIQETYGLDGWWAQSVTVGYERIKGLRERGQRRDGTYEATRSRTFAVPVMRLFDAWADASARQCWLQGATVQVRKATPPTTLRFDWSDHEIMSGTSIVVVGFTTKGEGRSSVAVQHAKLPDRETADRLKRYWSEQLEALGAYLAGR